MIRAGCRKLWPPVQQSVRSRRTVKPQPGDAVLEKAAATIFLGTNFELMLRNRNISTIIFTGITTEIGVESSARDASNRGFYPVVVSDCVSSMDKEAHDRSLQNMAQAFHCRKFRQYFKGPGLKRGRVLMPDLILSSSYFIFFPANVRHFFVETAMPHLLGRGTDEP